MTNEALERKPTAEEVERAQNVADNMTGTARPEFANEEERFKTVAMNFMGSVVNLLLSINSHLADINLLMQHKEEKNGE